MQLLPRGDEKSCPFMPNVYSGLHNIENEECFLIGPKTKREPLKTTTTNEDALKMLRSKRIGTFLVRFSAKQQQYCINSNNKVEFLYPLPKKLITITYYRQMNTYPFTRKAFKTKNSTT